MDFLTNCSTNVHAIEDLSAVRYRRLVVDTESGLSEAETWSSLQDAVAALRRDNLLCAILDDNLYMFEGTSDSIQPTVELFTIQEEGTLDDAFTKQSADNLLGQVLLDAVEGGISFNLARESSIIHVAPWEWIYTIPDEECDQPFSFLMKIHHHFIPSGSLFLVPEIKPTIWIPHDEHRSTPHDVLLAPFCIMAQVSRTASEVTIAGEPWKTSVSQTLASEGIYIDEDTEWIAVRPTQRNDSRALLWPSDLLFVIDPSIRSRKEGYELEHNWRSWFRPRHNGVGFRNLLSLAEEWFHESTNHAQLPAPSTGMTTSETPMDASSTLGEDTDMISPPYTQHGLDQQGMAAGIYPTPPDGANHSQQIFPSIASVTPSGTQGEIGFTPAENFQSSEDAHVKLENLASVDLGDFPSEQDELFGDSEEMEYVHNDVGDADFSFFDEPDDDERLIMPSEDSEMAELPQIDNVHEELPVSDLQQVTHETADDENPQHLPLDQEMVSDAHEAVQEEDKKDSRAESSAPEFEKPGNTTEKSLDPFGIRERLLPPPVPASVAQNDPRSVDEQRRNSTFAPIVFREGLGIGSRYNVGTTENYSSFMALSASPSISLPPTRKKSRLLKKGHPRSKDDDSESEEDSYESGSSETDENLPPRLPWDNRKRKRNNDANAAASEMSLRSPLSENEMSGHLSDETSRRAILRNKRLYEKPESETQAELHSALALHSQPAAINTIIAMDELFDLRKEDIVYIAQLILEQSTTRLPVQSQKSCESAPIDMLPMTTSACGQAVGQAIEGLFAQSDVCDLGKLSLARDPQSAPRAASNAAKGVQGQPRPLQRSDSFAPGPDYFSLQSPYVKVQRGSDSWEMLSTCLSFWETLGLSPANGPKSIRAFCVLPSNPDLQGLAGHFISELGTAYEGCKFGSHSHIRTVRNEYKFDHYEDGMAPVAIHSDATLEAALRAYSATCTELGKALAYLAQHEGNRTIVVYMVDPFQNHYARQYLCACFWVLFKAYRDTVPRGHRKRGGCDIVLQILPMEIIAKADDFIVPDVSLMSSLAREVYDRCPPSAAARMADNNSVFPIQAAPSVELAPTPPKRIGFQLSIEPPNDLLHEGSILHVAYALTPDKQWLVATWVDSTGQLFTTSAFPLRGRTFAAGAKHVWEQTREIISARQVTWRIFLVAADKVMENSTLRYWRTLTASKPRQQPLCVTMLSVQTDPELRLFAPDAQPTIGLTNEQGVLTPASTPSGGAAFTSSPDTSGNTPSASTTTNPAPPTPASSDIIPTTSSGAEPQTDPDAHLIDVTDESWGIIFSPRLTNLASMTGLANAAIYRRTHVDPLPEEEIPSLGVSLHWTIQVKRDGTVDEGSVKQAELTLREVLRMFRNLAVLTRAKGLEGGEMGLAPLHVAAAIQGARGVDGLLGAVVKGS